MFPNNIRISSQPQKPQGCQCLSRGIGWCVPHKVPRTLELRCEDGRVATKALKNFDDSKEILIVGSFVLYWFGLGRNFIMYMTIRLCN